MEYYILIAIAVIVCSFIAYKMYTKWLNYKLAKTTNKLMLDAYMECVITTDCPCGKERVAVPFHPQAAPEFKCKKCNKDCGYSVDLKTFIKG